MGLQVLTTYEAEEVGGGYTQAGAQYALGATLLGIAGGVATGGVLGVVIIAGSALGGFSYAADAGSDMKNSAASAGWYDNGSACVAY